jgi:hypothetical protein
MLRLFNRKKQAVKKRRSRTWTIDPKKTNLNIIVKKAKTAQHVPLGYTRNSSRRKSPRLI